MFSGSSVTKCIHHSVTSDSSLSLLECKLTTAGQEYKGTEAVTKSGKQCQSWPHSYIKDGDTNNRFPDAKAGDAENFCRNPNNRPLGPWCFTSLDAQKEWEYCNIPYCDDVIITGKKKVYTQLSCKMNLIDLLNTWLLLCNFRFLALIVKTMLM